MSVSCRYVKLYVAFHFLWFKRLNLIALSVGSKVKQTILIPSDSESEVYTAALSIFPLTGTCISIVVLAFFPTPCANLCLHHCSTLLSFGWRHFVPRL